MSLSDSGTHTSTDTSEVTLSEKTDPGTYVLKVDLTNMAVDDVVTVLVYDKVLPAGAYAVWQRKTYSGVQSEPVVATDPLVVDSAVKASIKQTAGSTYRDIYWALHVI